MSCAPTNLTFNTWDINGSNLVSIHPLHYKLRGSIGKIKFFFRLACVYSFLVEFWWNFLCWCKTVNILQKIFFCKYCTKICHFLNKTWRGRIWNLKFYMKTNWMTPKKMSQNSFFSYSTPSWWKCNLKINKYFFLTKCLFPNIWDVV